MVRFNRSKACRSRSALKWKPKSVRFQILPRLERFINDQFELEQWRKRRSKTDVAAVVEEELREGMALRGTDTNRDELFERMRSLMESRPDDQ